MNKKPPLSAFLSMLLLFKLLVAFCSAVPAYAELSWDIQIVSEDASFIGNGYCPIKVDSEGNPHLAYSGSPKWGYVSWNGSEWDNQQIRWGDVHDLVLDANDNPHTTYGSLTYATWNKTKWEFQTVTTDPTVYSSLTLDSSGNPHVAYITGDELKYATQNGSNWTTQTVDTNNNLPGIDPRLSLALDSNDTPHIMYYSESYFVDEKGLTIRSMDLKLAVLQNSSWTIELVLTSLNLVAFGNMVLDSAGHPHFLAKQYLYPEDSDSPIRTVEYFRWDGSAWKTQTVTSNVSLTHLGLLDLDSEDRPHIIYITEFPEQLMYARWTGTTWSSNTVDTQRIIYKPCYLAVDSEGNPHISYLKIPPDQSYFPDTLNLMYATANVTEPTEVAPTFPALPLLLASTAVIIGVVIVTVYFKKRKS